MEKIYKTWIVTKSYRMIIRKNGRILSEIGALWGTEVRSYEVTTDYQFYHDVTESNDIYNLRLS